MIESTKANEPTMLVEDDEGNFHIIKLSDVYFIKNTEPDNPDGLLSYTLENKVYYGLHTDKAIGQFNEYLKSLRQKETP